MAKTTKQPKHHGTRAMKRTKRLNDVNECTLSFMRRRPRVTATDLMEAFELRRNTAFMRLNELVRCGLAVRVAKGLYRAKVGA